MSSVAHIVTVRSTEYLPVGALRPGLSPRLAGEDEAHVRMLAECGARLPPILVQRSTLVVVDGMHRLRAAELRGDTRIEVSYVDGPDDEIFVRAVEENIAHGLPLSLSDRKAAAARILAVHPEWSDRMVAKTVGLSPKTAGVVRRRAAEEIPQLHTRIGQDGRSRPLRSVEPRRVAAELIASHPETSLREVARRTGVSMGTARRVRQELAAGGSAGQERVASTQRDGRTIVQALANDPSLRFSEAGRGLLRRLTANAIEPAEWEELLAAVPPHCVDLVAEIAADYGRAWNQFAKSLRSAEKRPAMGA
ncbi:ParB N-terminal domain-containing protein [Kitasatospora sp. NBC_01250]|uniref:ParB/RepB/Spo0J family partition protein n=1 Tax=unclassified Kitasatospora TaxID=2633591 RepID=UPI002E10623A|nr:MULTISPECIES: ParB/RepB/Spo0J family partition protein [unclassified Kitasatospora]WSJ70775.1 ParB N-terminal domain-containing protein [Kitasatospora sp. NBC_01302]